MSTDGQGTKGLRNIAENFRRLSSLHERYRQQTDGRQHIVNAKNLVFYFVFYVFVNLVT